VRTLGALVSGVAVALEQVREKKESGELPAGEAPAAEEASAPEDKAEPEEKPAQEDDNNADVSAEDQPENAETNPKED
jgi:large subunit ribosomal protein L10